MTHLAFGKHFKKAPDWVWYAACLLGPLGMALAAGAAYHLKVVSGQPFAAFAGENRLTLGLIALGLLLSLLCGLSLPPRQAMAGAGGEALPEGNEAALPVSGGDPAVVSGRRRATGKVRRRFGLALVAGGIAAMACVVRDTLRSPLGLGGPVAFGCGLAALVAGSVLLERRRHNLLADLGLTGYRGKAGWWRHDGLWLGLFLAGWSLLQLRQLDTRPGFFNIDEGIIVNYGHAVYAPAGGDPLTAAWENEFHPFLSCVPRALAADLFPGHPFLGSRLVAVLVGALTLGLLFMVARRLGGRLTAWLALLLLGFNQIFLTLGRYGMTNLDSVALAALWTLAGVGMWRSRRRSLALLAGMVQGLGVYFYFATLTLLPIAGTFLLVEGIIRPRAVWRRRGLLAVYCLGVLLARTPDLVYYKLAHFSMREPSWHVNTVMLLSRANLEGAFQQTHTQSVPELLKAYTWPAVGGMLLWPHGGYPADYFSKELPIVERGTAVLFLAALAVAAGHWRRKKWVLLLMLWFLWGALAPSLLTMNAPYAPRLVIGLAAMHLLAAWGVAMAAGLLGRVGRPLAMLAAVAALVWAGAAGWQQGRYFYGRFIQDRTSPWYSVMPWGFVDFLKTFPKDAQMVYYAAGPYNQFHNSVIKMVDRGFSRQAFTAPGPLPAPLPGRRTAYVFELPTFSALSKQFRLEHPGLRRIELMNPFHPEQGATYHVYWVD